jgi:dienelactone hydrolase
MKRARWLRRLAATLGVVAAVITVVWLLGEAFKTRDYVPYFKQRSSALVSVSETVLDETPAFSVVHVVLRSELGIEVEGHLRVPTEGPRACRTLVILGGVQTGRKTVEYLGDTGDWLVLALDYPYRGPKRGLSRTEFLASLPAMRRAVLDTVPAGMLALDYLLRRGDVDPDRIVLAGGSFGALFAPALAAADERVSAVAILFGAGDLGELIDANLELSWPLKPVVTWAGSVMVSPLEPLKYVGRISPRPVFMLNGTDDPAMPERCSRALHEAAREPKTVRWLPVGHVSVRSVEFHERVVGEFVAWLKDIGFLSSEETFELLPE